MGKSVRQPLEPTDFFTENKAQVIPNMFGKSTTKETTGQGNFSPKNYPHLNNPTPFDDPETLQTIAATKQPIGETLSNTALQFGANVVSSMGQGLANTFDLVDLAKTAKAEITGGKDTFESNLFGLTTREMQDWANGIAQRNPILEKKEGTIDFTDAGWWAKQIASTGTGIGMGLEALGTTALIEAATGGIGTAAALAKLGSLGKKLVGLGKGAEVLSDAVAAARGLKSAATVYGIMSRTSESRMEAMQSYDDIMQDLDKQVTKEGLPKYNKEEKEKIASAGARVTFNGNMALLPLDILSYRTMVFNPISGSGEGLIEKALGSIGNKAARAVAQWGTNMTLESAEEGAQYIMSDEGKHYAQVLSGRDDESTFGQRLKQDIQSNEFWNNVLGGAIGSPVIGGAMKAVNSFMNGKKAARLNDLHNYYLQNVGKMDSRLATEIKDLQLEGKNKEASVARKQFNANRSLAALHYDAMADKDTAFDAHMTFINGVLEEINNGKTDALGDLGFNNPTPEQLQVIKDEFQQYARDANQMKSIYDAVKSKYNRSFVPEITQDHFHLAKLMEEQAGIDTELSGQRKAMLQYDNLSPRGKELFDSQYRLESLRYEADRLTEIYREAEGAKEKEALEQIAELNKQKTTDISNKIKEINEDTSYNISSKNSDADIISSSLVNKDYLQTIYDNEHLQNEIALQRKRVNLWNNPEYAAERTQQAIKNAKTKQQARDIADNTNDPKIQQQVEERETEIASQEAAQNIIQQNDSIGDDDLFADDNNFINEIKESTIPIGLSVDNTGQLEEGQEAGMTSGIVPEALFSPSVYNFDKSSDEAKLKIKNGVSGLLSKLGNDINFEGLVRHVVKIQGATVADNIYNALKYGWEANGKPIEDYDAIYNKVFSDPMDELMQGISQLTIQNTKQLENANDIITEDVSAHEQGQPEFDNNNQPIYKYKGIITNESSPKLAFVTRLTHLVQSTDENGAINVAYEFTEEELNTLDYVDSLPLLDPDQFNEGTELTISIPDNFNDIKIPVYSADGTKQTSVTFGQYVAEHKISSDSQEYRDKIPMFISKKGLDKPVAFVHDIGWYHPLRFNQEFKDDMANAINQTRAIREEVLTSPKQTTQATITGKRQTTFAGLKTAKDQTITLKEANPDTKLTIALTSDSLSTSKKNIAFPNENTVLVNNSPFKVGQILEVRRFGLKDGKETYVALPVFRKKLDEASRTSVLQAITIYSNRGNKNEATRTQHDKIAKSILDSMGIDILSQQGLEKYLKHFIAVFNTEKAFKNEDVEIQAKAKLAAGTPYIAIIAGGNIVFGRAGQPAYVNKAGQKVGSFFINPNSTTTSPIAAINNLAKPEFIGWYEQNVDLNNLNINSPIVTIDKTGVTSVSAPTYNDYLLERLHTNIRSHNIGTEDKPNYVTNIQPVITYDTNSRLNGISQPETNQEVREQFLKETTTTETINKENIENKQSTQEAAKAALEKAKAKLGKDFKAGGKKFFSPTALTDAQIQAIASSINRIAGLTPSQQFDITDFMYNQITAMVNFENKHVTRAIIDVEVDRAFKEVIEPLKLEYQQDIKENKEILAASPEVAGEFNIQDVIDSYQYRLDKIKAVEDNIDILKQEAYARVAKYTGITEERIKFEAKEDDENETDDRIAEDIADTTVDFWTDILSESPDNKLTYSMRRFFGQIKNVDKDGELVRGFLGLPTYVGADSIIRTLMVTLADIPASFDAMIAKLESRKDALPWMNEVIEKLKNTDKQKKAQFVTVMSNTLLRMKFTMISFNRKTGTWTTKVYDTNSNGVANAVRSNWDSGFIESDLVVTDAEKNYTLDLDKANKLIDTFRGWKGLNIKEVTVDMSAYRDSISGVKNNSTITIQPTGALLQQLKTNIVKATDRMKFSMKGFNYQITGVGNGKYKIDFLSQTVATKEDAGKWLEGFGIKLSPETLDELYNKGLYHNYEQRKWVNLFEDGANSNGLFGILYNKLQILVDKGGALFNEEGGKPLDDSVLNSLANLEAKYTNTAMAIGFRDGKKNIFAISTPKFITDRVRDLKTKDHVILEQLKQISFSQNSLWLRLLGNDKFRDKFGLSHIGLTAMKQLGVKAYRDNGITNLSDLDHELTKLGMFCDTTQGELESGVISYPGTKIDMRMATVFSPTMSDKQMMTLITTAVLDLQNKDLKNGDGLSEEVTKIIYEETIKPELARMIKFWQNGGKTNISAYDKGAAMFLFMPKMNEIELEKGLKLVDAIKNQPNVFNLQTLENNKDLMKSIYDNIGEYIDALKSEKLEVWEKTGLIKRETNQDVIKAKLIAEHPEVAETINNNQDNLQGDVTEIKFVDNKYLNKFRGSEEEKANMIALDFVVNNLICNANSFMLMAGDPALYYKSKARDSIQQAKDTFVNVGKRLANQIAPGTSLSDSEHEKYIQIFINDRKSVSESIDYLERLLGKDEAASYRSIEGSDAQEYTTWKEHLGILAKLGKTADTMLDISPSDIEEARRIFAEGTPKSQLTETQQKLISKVMQPIKPVYTGQIYDKQQDVMRTVYIKSSSFPLIPQLTVGFEIDKLRLAMEKIEKARKMPVRASYQTANKVGSINTPANIWNEDGTINQESLDNLDSSSLVLDRKNFRIQQEVPFKSGKRLEDTITLGTQIMKLLFGDEILNYDGFNFNGKSYSGNELHHIYNDAFIRLVQSKRSGLFKELGLDENGDIADKDLAISKLQEILKNEAINRGYPLQDIEGLKLDADGNFNLPLWSSSNSNRYESMLNAIVGNRLIKMKFPGNSYVVGSEEGFKTNIPQIILPIGTSGSGKSTWIKSLTKDSYVVISPDEMRVEFTGDINDKSKDKEIYEEVKIRTIQAAKRGKTVIIDSTNLQKDRRRDFINGIKNSKVTASIEYKLLALNPELAKQRIKADIDKGVNRANVPDSTIDRHTLLYEEMLKDIKEEDIIEFREISETNNKSNIIYTSAWNGSHLTGSFHENGEIKKAQVFVASKFRDREGNLIDLMAKEGGEYKYVTKNDNGNFILKESAFDKDLLSLLSFRIPTSGHQSGSQVEIAGFLPYMVGDLMIVPKDFTKQKGLDFDVDKENTYQYWHYQTNDGKFEVLSEKHRTEILTAAEHEKASNKKLEQLMTKLKEEKEAGAGPIAIQKIKGDIKAALAGQKLIQGLLGDVEYTEEDIEDAGLAKLNAKIDEKLLQNTIVGIHNAIFSNPKIQNKIVKTLNTDYAEKQADFIDGIISSNVDTEYWTPLSDEYQKGKMGLGSAGKIGTGAYSLDVVGHSLFQQSRLNGKPIEFKTLIVGDDEDKKVIVNKTWRFGNIKSDGILGGTKTLDGGRTISEVMAERQNIAVDNEKLQVMGRVNLNDLTLDVDKTFNMLGFDKGSDGNDISFLFLSQPIIREYVENMKNANSNMADFELNKEQKIVERLTEKYLGEAEELDEDMASDLMDNEKLVNELKNPGKENGQLQAAILKRFMDMKAYGIALRGIQTTINTDSKGLGKSFFDIIEKRNALNRLGTSGGLIEGASDLIGDYLFKEDLGGRVDDLIAQGYVDIGNYLVKPTTLSGAFNIMGVTTAYNLWKNYFPYDSSVTQMAFDEIIPIISNGEIGDSKKIELKQEIFKNIKKYFSAFKKGGIISIEDDINEERRRIYIDSDENTSLAKYLKSIKEMSGNDAVDEFIKTNKLLNRFEFDIQKDGQPSKIKYNNAAGEEFDEQYLYEALASMIEARGPEGEKIVLPEIGNKKYTLDSLAQDLIAYSMLGNSTQEAIQFTKYIPVSYLDAVGYSRVMRVAGEQLDTNPALLGLSNLKTEKEKHLVSEFSMQFIQHNPERVKYKLDAKTWKNDIVDTKYGTREANKLENLESFKLKDDKVAPTFVSIYNSAIPKGEKKFQLYWFDGEKYTRIPVLGTFGMDEYQPTGDRNTIGSSLINGRVRIKISPQPQIDNVVIDGPANDRFGISSGNIQDVVKSISESNIEGFSDLAKQLLPYVNNGLKIQYADEVGEDTFFNGLYDSGTNTIYVSPLRTKNLSADELAKTVIHETIHGLTVNQIKPYINTYENGHVQVLQDAPSYVSDLVKLYNDIRSKHDTTDLDAVLYRVKKNKGVTPEELATKYGLTNIYEFISMAMTEPEFQKYLSKTEFKQSGVSLLDKFKQVINNILSKLGVKFEADSATAKAINSIFDFIENTNSSKTIEEFNSEIMGDDFKDDSYYNDEFDDNFTDGNPVGSFLPTTFPNKVLDIQTVKCI